MLVIRRNFLLFFLLFFCSLLFSSVLSSVPAEGGVALLGPVVVSVWPTLCASWRCASRWCCSSAWWSLLLLWWLSSWNHLDCTMRESSSEGLSTKGFVARWWCIWVVMVMYVCCTPHRHTHTHTLHTYMHAPRTRHTNWCTSLHVGVPVRSTHRHTDSCTSLEREMYLASIWLNCEWGKMYSWKLCINGKGTS